MQAYPQAFVPANKGTLVPGQSITVNKYTVVVERYLSQGGFAHVYLVRTAQPLYNTSHHVLKRIAVPNEAMLSEVKKEVDIMRILKGHPNIVFLIDAAWHRMANGTYEVFILMEFCPGGGIIDMMNRRLRERLTEAEILTIFVEVCEGLAAMHALKPPILHRDLKVENILQASPSSYKLCDFGSATPVQKVPTNTQELRTLETDLNRHTTLQYRAPEMIDVHLRRPIDEKSDVWALGVLLYKLCYYTTPFEEHGPLAILNVQYKIPPYPVYSAQMNSLIASMLKEHGAQRPSIFEILLHVHNLRGTKSRFTYDIPDKGPLSPRSLQAPLQTLSTNVTPLDDLVTYKSRQPTAKNAGVEARDKVLEAIAPMRRGRPQSHGVKVPSRPVSPEKAVAFETKFGEEDDRALRGLRAARSGYPSPGSDSASLGNKADADASSIASRQSTQKPDAHDRRTFDDDFVGTRSRFRSPPMSKPAENNSSAFVAGFGDAFDPSKPRIPPVEPRPPQPVQPSSRLRQSRMMGKDAFDGLGLSTQSQAPTLGETRMSRTGLARFESSSGSSSVPYNLTPPKANGLGTSNTMYRPPSVHASRPTPSPQPQVQPQSTNLSPIPAPSQTWQQHLQASASSQDDLTAEERFPSLEDLDRTFGTPSPSIAPEKPPPMPSRLADRPPSRNSHKGSMSSQGLNVSGAKGRYDGVRSQQVTGTAMRDARVPGSRQSTFLRSAEPVPTKVEDGSARPLAQHRPSLSRKHRSSVSVKTLAPAHPETLDLLTGIGRTTPSLPPRPQPVAKSEPQDWLTGADEEMGMPLGMRSTGSQNSQPVLRNSPSKRASFIERSPIGLQMPLEAENVLPQPAPMSAAIELGREWDMAMDRLDRIPAGKTEREKRQADERSMKEVKRRSKSPATTKAFITRNDVSVAGLGLDISPRTGSGAGAIRSMTPSPNGLTDNWSPVASPKRPRSKQGSTSSSSDGGPEDVNGYVPPKSRVRGDASEKIMGNGTGADASARPAEGQRRRRTRSKSRQSSVHDLVDLWGGATKGPTQAAPGKRSSLIVPASTMKPPTLTNSKPRSSSPQPMDTQVATDGQSSGSLPSPIKHAKQPSAQSGSRRLPIPPSASSPTTTDPPAGRSRPASMFISSLSALKSNPEETGAPSSSEAAASFAQQVLSPSGTPRSHKSTRRSSISDMVQRYEAIGVTKPKGQGPGPPAKPAALSPKPQQSTSSTSPSDIASPSAAASRFPKLSPAMSPVSIKASLSVPEDTGRLQFGRDFAKHRTSPTGLPSRLSPVGRPDTQFSSSFHNTNSSSSGVPAAPNGLPSRRSPVEPSRASVNPDMGAPPSPRFERKLSAQLESGANPHANVRSPSPEKPYQGVSKLIDRWQRAADETTPDLGARRGGAPAWKAGVVSGSSGR